MGQPTVQAQQKRRMVLASETNPGPCQSRPPDQKPNRNIGGNVKTFLGCLAILVIIALGWLITGGVVLLLWNLVVPAMFGGPVITFWQAVVACMLISVIGKLLGFGKGGEE